MSKQVYENVLLIFPIIDSITTALVGLHAHSWGTVEGVGERGGGGGSKGYQNLRFLNFSLQVSVVFGNHGT